MSLMGLFEDRASGSNPINRELPGGGDGEMRGRSAPGPISPGGVAAALDRIGTVQEINPLRGEHPPKKIGAS